MDDSLRYCLGLRAAGVYRRLDRLFNRAFRAVGLPYAHAQLLLLLLEEGEMSVKGLARRTGLDPSTVSRLAKELSRRKLIQRGKDPDDARVVRLSPAKRGRALHRDMQAIQERLNGQLRRDLVAADLEAFFRLAEQLEPLP